MSNTTSPDPSIVSGSGSGSDSSEQSNGALYIILAIASPVVYSTVNVVDKTAVSTRVKHTPSYLSLIGIVDMIIAAIIAACCDWSAEAMANVQAMDFIIPAISGVAWAGSIYCYYMGMMLTDASIIVGVEYLYPLVVMILSAIFLDEVIQPMGYVGCVLLVIGAISLSLNFIGMICKRRKRKKQMYKANEERGLVLGAGYGPFQKAVIPAGMCASINDAQTPEEAREAFNAMLNWRGTFVMPVMEEPKVNRVGDSYVDMEAGCAPGVDCWCPCGTYCANCHKVVSTKGDEPRHGSDKKRSKKDKSDAAADQQQQQAGAKTRSSDSRKSLESSRNARVRAAGRAAVQATVDRPTPSYDDVVAEQQQEKEQQPAEDAERPKEHHKKKKKHHHHHHHKKEGVEQSPVKKDKKLESSEEDTEEGGSYPADTTSTTSSAGKKSVDDDAIPLDEMDAGKSEEQAGAAEAAGEAVIDTGAAEEKQEEAEEEEEEERNCITRITAWCTRHRKSKGLLMLVLLPLVILLALTEFLAKVATAGLSTFNVCSINFFVYGFCMFAIFFVRPFKGPKYFVSELKRNWLFCLLSDVLTLGAQFLLIFAMSGMQASVVSSLAAIQPLITLCFERIFGIASDTLKECLSYKLVPIVLVVAGVVLLSIAAI